MEPNIRQLSILRMPMSFVCSCRGPPHCMLVLMSSGKPGLRFLAVTQLYFSPLADRLPNVGYLLDYLITSALKGVLLHTATIHSIVKTL